MIKPQDVVLLVRLFHRQGVITQGQLAQALFISVSEINAGLRRLGQSHLISLQNGCWVVHPEHFTEFLIRALPYIFPAERGEPTTGLRVKPDFALSSDWIIEKDMQPVWPHEASSDQGFMLKPLYPTVPKACLQDTGLYQWMAVLDTLRDWEHPLKPQATRWIKALTKKPQASSAPTRSKNKEKPIEQLPLW